MCFATYTVPTLSDTSFTRGCPSVREGGRSHRHTRRRPCCFKTEMYHLCFFDTRFFRVNIYAVEPQRDGQGCIREGGRNDTDERDVVERCVAKRTLEIRGSCWEEVCCLGETCWLVYVTCVPYVGVMVCTLLGGKFRIDYLACVPASCVLQRGSTAFLLKELFSRLTPQE